MRRRVPIAVFLGWVVLLTGCAGKLAMFGEPSSLQVTGSSSTVRLEETTQFAAATTSGSLTGLQWSVNGIPGGNAQFGTIDARGRYTAPASLPENNRLTISASSADAQGSVEIALWNPIPEIASVSTRDLGDSVELIISGRKFVSGAKVNFGGTIYPGTFASSTQLQATVPRSAAAAGSVEMAVSNPDPGEAFSETTMFSLSRPTRPARGSASNAAARFLDQATFGPTTADVAAINQLRSSLGTMQQAMSQWIDD